MSLSVVEVEVAGTVGEARTEEEAVRERGQA